MDVDSKITSMYENVSYLGMYGIDVVYTILIFAITLAIVSYSTYTAVIRELQDNWNKHKCSPVIIPFAGIIMPKPGQTTMETTFENFNYCIQQDITASFGFIMMPFEFVLYLTIIFLDATLESIKVMIETLSWIKNQIGEIFEQFYNKIVNFIIPLIEMLVYMRDMLGKINGIITTALYTIMNIYNLTVSGVVNILTILVNLLIGLIVTLVAMILAAFALYMIPIFGIPLGVALQFIVMGIVFGVLVPALVVCIIMNNSISDIFNEGSPSAPQNPF